MKTASASPPQVINLENKFSKFDKTYAPHIVADVNDFWVLLAKLDGKFVEHRHDDEDELFLVLKGQLTIQMKDQTVTLDPGEIFVVPRGTDHLPSATKGTQVLLLERKTVKHTGDKKTARTVTEYKRI
ncbi:MAG TPA: cupin domain-containing protein [Candidatus Thermoplasmatota archaeon]